MCRRCGEPDKRGSNRNRRARKLWFLTEFGDGEKVPCYLCDRPLTYAEVTADRLVPGGPYARWNVRPACLPCNRSRARPEIPDGCLYG